jgi:hypothetical protein
MPADRDQTTAFLISSARDDGRRDAQDGREPNLDGFTTQAERDAYLTSYKEELNRAR